MLSSLYGRTTALLSAHSAEIIGYGASLTLHGLALYLVFAVFANALSFHFGGKQVAVSVEALLLESAPIEEVKEEDEEEILEEEFVEMQQVETPEVELEEEVEPLPNIVAASAVFAQEPTESEILERLEVVDVGELAPPNACPVELPPQREAAQPTRTVKVERAEPTEEPSPRPVQQTKKLPRQKPQPPSPTIVAVQQMVGVDDLSPRPIYSPAPPYPATAVFQGLSGRVLLRLTVSAEGTVSLVEVLESSGFPVLDNAAVATIRTWRFEPPRLGGVPVETRARLPVNFRGR